MLAEFLKRSLFKPSEETVHVRAAMHSLLRLIPTACNLLDVGCGDGKATKLYASTWNIRPDNIAGIERQEKYKRVMERFTDPRGARGVSLCRLTLAPRNLSRRYRPFDFLSPLSGTKVKASALERDDSRLCRSPLLFRIRVFWV